MLKRETVPYTYDGNGNTLSKTNRSGTTNYAWDFENRLTSVTAPTGSVTSFTYDPFGRRIRKSNPSGTTIYVYDGDNIIEDLDPSGNLVERYTYGPGVDEPLVGQRNPKIFFYEADGLGSITSLTDPTGAVAVTYYLRFLRFPHQLHRQRHELVPLHRPPVRLRRRPLQLSRSLLRPHVG